jgi:hypothetical protein
MADTPLTASSVLQDLNIDPQLMIDDPDEFSKQVLDAGQKLQAIMDGQELPAERAVRTAIDAAATKAEDVAKFNSFVTIGNMDELSNTELVQLAAFFEHKRKSILYLLEERFTDKNVLDIRSKRMAAWEYKRLRELYDSFKNFRKFFDPDKKYPILSARPGNYQSSERLFFYVYKGQEYGVWAGLAIRLGLNGKFKNRMDFHEYLEEHPELEVQVIVE